jgi:UDP-N-acetyl-2-amino-2-deoxyglucuronate dehydrogenase
MLMAIKEKISTQDKKHDVIIQYYTPRGKWYHASWKGDVKKSGGIATNIGIHLFDLAYWLFGDLKSLNVEKNSTVESSGSLALEHANVHWHLSIDTSIAPKRQLIIDGEVYEFTDGFADLHTASYNEILQKKGFTSDDVKPSIDITERIRLQ